MNFFLHKLINYKKYIFIIFFTVFSFGFLFGLFKYQNCNKNIVNFFNTLFIVNNDKLIYYSYLYQNIIYIVLATYLSTSYLGIFGISFLIFLKGIQYSFSIINLFSLKLTPMLILLIIIQFLIELIFIILIFIPNFQLSIQTLIISFFMKDNFNYKSILNYNLNNIIIEIITLIISLSIKIYII